MWVGAITRIPRTQVAEDSPALWQCLTPENLEKSGYDTEATRAPVVLDMLKMKLSLCVQGSAEGLHLAILRLAAEPPDWAPLDIKLDLSCMRTMLSAYGGEIMDSAALTEIDAAFAEMDTSRHALCSYLLQWPNGEALIKSLRNTCKAKQTGLRLQNELIAEALMVPSTLEKLRIELERDPTLTEQIDAMMTKTTTIKRKLLVFTDVNSVYIKNEDVSKVLARVFEVVNRVLLEWLSLGFMAPLLNACKDSAEFKKMEWSIEHFRNTMGQLTNFGKQMCDYPPCAMSSRIRSS